LLSSSLPKFSEKTQKILFFATSPLYSVQFNFEVEEGGKSKEKSFVSLFNITKKNTRKAQEKYKKKTWQRWKKNLGG
jgi:predicted Zn-dependent protease